MVPAAPTPPAYIVDSAFSGSQSLRPAPHRKSATAKSNAKTVQIQVHLRARVQEGGVTYTGMVGANTCACKRHAYKRDGVVVNWYRRGGGTKVPIVLHTQHAGLCKEGIGCSSA